MPGRLFTGQRPPRWVGRVECRRCTERMLTCSTYNTCQGLGRNPVSFGWKAHASRAALLFRIKRFSPTATWPPGSRAQNTGVKVPRWYRLPSTHLPGSRSTTLPGPRPRPLSRLPASSFPVPSHCASVSLSPHPATGCSSPARSSPSAPGTASPRCSLPPAPARCRRLLRPPPPHRCRSPQRRYGCPCPRGALDTYRRPSAFARASASA